MLFQRMFNRIPMYGQLIHKSGVVTEGWYDSHKSYESVMLKGVRRLPQHKKRIYLVLTEAAIEDAISRAAAYKDQVKFPIVFGYYNGKSSFETVKSGGCIPKTCDLIFLRLFRCKNGNLEAVTVALTERHFKRSLDRAKMHPELVVKYTWKSSVITALYKAECFVRKLFGFKV